MATSVFDVRPATTRDAKAIAQLHNATVKEAFKGMLGDLDVAIMPLAERERYWSEAIQYAEPQVQVALHGAKIIGFVGYDRSRDEGTPATMGELWAMYVDTDFWGLGAGLSLWDAALEGLVDEECTHVSVWLPLANDRALRFFELAGFKREMATAKTVPIGGVKVEEIRLQRALG
jgi:GNAT superfamily N-acetyltransferase